MKKLSPDTKLGVGVVLLLVLVTVFVAAQQEPEQEYPALSSLSPAPNGALALKLWVKELGYAVNEQTIASFAPPEDASILFMLEPLFPMEGEMVSIDDWVDEGGTLIVIGDQYGMYSLIDHYDFSFSFPPERTGLLGFEAPLLLSPTESAQSASSVRVTLDSERDDYVTLMTYQSRPVLVSFEQGQGRVILGTITESFTNAGLKETGNPELALNVLALARSKGIVWFDEWHHGVRSGDQILGPAEFLRATPLGRSLLFVTFAVFITFLLQGRGFGKPVPLPQEIKRRGALEHVTGFANLSRRAAHHAAVMSYYHDQIKRKLGQRYRLDSAMDDEQYVGKLSEYNPAIEKDDLLNLLKRLKRGDMNETEMVHLAVEASKWIDTQGMSL
jgi:hypothetical protein